MSSKSEIIVQCMSKCFGHLYLFLFQLWAEKMDIFMHNIYHSMRF